MDRYQWHHLHHHNQSYSTQGNTTLCPTCSISHFPFCPPRAPHVPPPPPPLPPSLDPYIDPSRNPSMTHMSNFESTNAKRYNPGFGDEYSYFSDRNSKRLRVDGVDESQFRLAQDRGGGVIHDFGEYRDVGSHGKHESFGFNGNVDARDQGRVSSVGNNSYRDEMGYQSGYGSYGGVKKSAFDGQSGSGNMGHGFCEPYGNVVNQVDTYQGYGNTSYGSSYGANESSYGTSFEQPQNTNHGSSYGNSFEQPRVLNNAPMPYEHRNNVAMASHYSGTQAPFVNAMQQHDHMRYDTHSSGSSQFSDGRYPHGEGYQSSFGNQHVSIQPHYGPSHGDNNHGGYGNSYSQNMGHFRASQGVDVRPPPPPLPASPPPPPPPPLPMEPPPLVSSSLFPVVVSSSSVVQSSYSPTPEFHMPSQPHLPNARVLDSSRGMMQRDFHPPLTPSVHSVRESSCFPSKNSFEDKPKVLDASQLFKQPHRATRPDHFVIILRGLPGSGKSYLAKMLRDLEVEHGGNAPRIHSMDDYFMTEVEKADENETSKSSSRGKKPIMKKVLEYCYEPEMEEAYRASMLKAFKKTLDEGAFTFVIVDDRNLRVADFSQFWATSKRSGYEVYVLEAPYKDPAGCAARNVHSFTQYDVEKMAGQWEESPPLYLQLDIKSLFRGDDLAESNIQEVDMDTEDGDFEGSLPEMDMREPRKSFESSSGDVRSHESWDGDDDNQGEVKELGHSKWSTDMDDEDDERFQVSKGKPNVLSGLVKTYGKEGKSVHWGDQGGHTGFSIGAAKKANTVSLVIGPGAGYNLKSNPMPDEDDQTSTKSGETRKHRVFMERLRAEQESFKAVFDRRRQRIGGVDDE